MNNDQDQQLDVNSSQSEDLETFDFTKNRLTCVPVELGKLTSLEWLYLDDKSGK